MSTKSAEGVLSSIFILVSVLICRSVIGLWYSRHVMSSLSKNYLCNMLHSNGIT